MHEEKYFEGKDMNLGNLTHILVSLLAVIEKTSPAGISAWARYPGDLALRFRSILDPLHPDGSGMEIFIDQHGSSHSMNPGSDMPDRFGHYESDEYFRPLFEAAAIQRTEILVSTGSVSLMNGPYLRTSWSPRQSCVRKQRGSGGRLLRLKPESCLQGVYLRRCSSVWGCEAWW